MTSEQALYIFIGFTIITVLWFILKIVKVLKSIPFIEQKLSQQEKKFNHLKAEFNDDSQYMRFSKFKHLNDELNNLQKQIKGFHNIIFIKKINNLLGEIRDFELGLSARRDSTNQRFFEFEKNRASRIFIDDQNNDLLTDEQLKAVLCNDERNLVIAGAGSGKTRVIDFKVQYLVKYKNVDPQKILLLSFSKKSAEDIAKKVSESTPGVEVKTIHSFASQVIGRHERKIFDDSKKEFEALVIKALAEALKEKEIFRIFETFYQQFFSVVKPLIFYKNLDDLRKDLKKINSRLIDIPDQFGEIKARRALKTLKGEFVRSVDERYIADFLYLQDIQYEYEHRYPHSDQLYYPDFYLPDYDVYLEHFAITSSGKPPPYFDEPEKYMASILWKRNLHKEKQTRLIESYSYLLNQEDTSQYLTEILTEGGIHVHDHLESEKSYSIISREFCRVFTRFYHSFKLAGLSFEELKQKYTEHRYVLFLQLFENFLSHLRLLIAKENKIDFNDMLIEAVDRYKKGLVRSFDYVIVDEFQDTSNLAMNLIDEILKDNPQTTFVSVGDDWQSIYGFNGSDASIISNYEKKYSGVSVRNLNSNFRSHSKIVELGKQFISKNPAQIQKAVVSKNVQFSHSEIGFLTFEQMEEKINDIPDDESIFVLYRYNDDCPATRGIFTDFFTLDKLRRPIRRVKNTKNISMMTIHASKGLEAQHVFILFPDGNRRKFPSEVEDHFIFNMLKRYSDDFPFSEERRLMYVAMTRAKQNLYFVSPHHKEVLSVFWEELKDILQGN